MKKLCVFCVVLSLASVAADRCNFELLSTAARETAEELIQMRQVAENVARGDAREKLLSEFTTAARKLYDNVREHSELSSSWEEFLAALRNASGGEHVAPQIDTHTHTTQLNDARDTVLGTAEEIFKSGKKRILSLGSQGVTLQGKHWVFRVDFSNPMRVEPVARMQAVRSVRSGPMNREIIYTEANKPSFIIESQEQLIHQDVRDDEPKWLIGDWFVWTKGEGAIRGKNVGSTLKDPLDWITISAGRWDWANPLAVSSPDGKKAIVKWHPPRGDHRLLWVIGVDPAPVIERSFAAEKPLLAVAINNKFLIAHTDKEKLTVRSFTLAPQYKEYKDASKLAFAPNNKWLAVFHIKDGKGQIDVLDSTTRNLDIMSANVIYQDATSLVFSEDSKSLLFEAGGSVFRWKLPFAGDTP